MTNTSIIHLSKEDAEDVFGSPTWDPMPVLNYWKEQFTDDNCEELERDLKFIILIKSAYHRYKSRDVRYLIMRLCNRFIKEIYTTEEMTLPLCKLKFLSSLILQFRNMTDYRKVKSSYINSRCLDRVRQGLFENGALPEYQTNLFNQ